IKRGDWTIAEIACVFSVVCHAIEVIDPDAFSSGLPFAARLDSGAPVADFKSSVDSSEFKNPPDRLKVLKMNVLGWNDADIAAQEWWLQVEKEVKSVHPLAEAMATRRPPISIQELFEAALNSPADCTVGELLELADRRRKGPI